MDPTVRAAAALVLLLAACPGEKGALERAVRDYDEELQRAYSTSDASRLPTVATRKEANRVLVLIDLKKAARRVLESKLESLEVTRAESHGDAGTVETRERWRYHDRPLDPGKPDGPERRAAMAMRYDLVREEGRWKVASVATVSNDYLDGTRPAEPGRPPPGHGSLAPGEAPADGGAATAPGTAPRR